ncbi:MAG TPA: DUF192 domain-containing protein [Burkholderiales bacterium]|nr:DUF192 domain-containing protein [Burkholderiales bacterium]
MKYGMLYEKNSGKKLLPEVWKASTSWERMRGLLGRPPLTAKQGLVIEPCRMVHTIGMRYPIDLAFIDASGRVRKLVFALSPGRIAGSLFATATLEFAAGTLRRIGLQPGDTLLWQEG